MTVFLPAIIMTEPPQEHIVIDAQQEPSVLLDINDPPPPYPSQPRTRTQRTGRRHRTARAMHNGLPNGERDHAADLVPHPQRLTSAYEPLETTPLLPQPPSGRRHFLRPRSSSHSSTIRSSSSCAPSLTQTVLSLFHDPDDEPEMDTADGHGQIRHGARLSQGHDVHDALDRPTRWPLFSKRGWTRYFRPFGRRAYHAAAFHLLLLNFPYALMAWVYLFVFTLVGPPMHFALQRGCTNIVPFKTGTTLIIALPIGAVLCFLDLLGARAFARGEVTETV